MVFTLEQCNLKRIFKLWEFQPDHTSCCLYHTFCQNIFYKLLIEVSRNYSHYLLFRKLWKKCLILIFGHSLCRSHLTKDGRSTHPPPTIAELSSLKFSRSNFFTIIVLLVLLWCLSGHNKKGKNKDNEVKRPLWEQRNSFMWIGWIE